MNDDRFAAAPEPPYYAVIFASQRAASSGGADDDYGLTSDRMVELARARDGFLGVESTRDATGFGITVSYWRDEAAIAGWKADFEHREAQRRGATSSTSGSSSGSPGWSGRRASASARPELTPIRSRAG